LFANYLFVSGFHPELFKFNPFGIKKNHTAAPHFYFPVKNLRRLRMTISQNWNASCGTHCRNKVIFEIMLTKEKILETLRHNKPFFEKELGVIRIGLFGSYAKDFDRAESDVDILVELRPPLANNFFALWIKLEKELNIKVDLVRKGDHLSEKFLQTVEKEIIYA
jgi:predicted nucleotidyltransferase